jgi:uncharacterized membrane protein YfhO
MPLWVKKFPFQQPSQKIENLNGHESINIISQTSNKIIFNAILTGKRIIQVNTIYFPGWNAYVNGISTKISYDNPQGVMRLNLEKGANTVKLLFIETPLRLVSDIVSLISLGILFILVIFKFRKENVKK